MVVKKRNGSSSFEKDDDFILPFSSDAGVELKQVKSQKRPLHECLDDGEPSSFWRLFSGKKQDLVLPTFTARCNPQAADISAPSNLKSTIVFTTWKRRATAFNFVVFGLVIFGLLAFSSAKSTLSNILEQIDMISQNRKTLMLKVRGAEKDVRVLEREVSALESMHRRRLEQQAEISATVTPFKEHSDLLKQKEDLQSSLKTRNELAGALRERVKTISRYEAKQKYGSGPQRVEIELDFGSGDSGSFVVELAPLNVMPHSVETFLGMVSAGLWDGCSFVMNAVHVVKATPRPSDGTSADEKMEAFEKKGLHRLAFKEYNEEFPHKQYTLGFAGGESPSWYINTEDNAEINQGDPCFGRVVDGFDAIHKLEKRPTKDGIWYEQPVGIKHARVMW